MKKETDGVFRGTTVPWHDSDKICFIIMTCMALVNFFAWTGLSTAFSKNEWKGYWHLPIILIAASFFVFLSIIRRIIVRHLMKKSYKTEISL